MCTFSEKILVSEGAGEGFGHFFIADDATAAVTALPDALDSVQRCAPRIDDGQVATAAGRAGYSDGG